MQAKKEASQDNLHEKQEHKSKLAYDGNEVELESVNDSYPEASLANTKRSLVTLDKATQLLQDVQFIPDEPHQKEVKRNRYRRRSQQEKIATA